MNTVRIFLLVILITIALPFEFYHLIGESRKFIMVFVHLLLLVDLIKAGKFKVSDFNLMFLAAGLISFTILFFYHKHPIYISYLIQFCAVFFILVYIDTFKLYGGYIKAYLAILLITGIGGVIGFFIAMSGQEPFLEIQSPRRLLYSYYFTLTPVYMDFGSFKLIRFSGYFDEPGKFAYYHLFGLYYAYLNNYSKRFLFFFAAIGMFTTSLAYIISILVVFAIYLFQVYKISLKRALFIFMTLFMLYALFNINTIYKSDMTDNIAWFVSSRLSFDFSSGSDEARLIVGDNRTANLIYSYGVFKENPIFGYDKFKPGYETDRMIANAMAYFAQHGIVGVMALYFMLGYLIVYVLTKNHRMSVYVILFLILLNFYQRPYFSSGYMGYLLIPTLLYSIKYYHLDKNDEDGDSDSDEKPDLYSEKIISRLKKMNLYPAKKADS